MSLPGKSHRNSTTVQSRACNTGVTAFDCPNSIAANVKVIKKEGGMSPTRLLAVLGLAAVANGCGGKTPAAPSQPATTVSGLAITGADAILTGLSIGYTAKATFADGSTRTIAPVWTSSNPAAASVDSMGGLTGRNHGTTTLTATYEGRSASKTVQVVNNYAGTWEGRFVIKACTDTGDLTDHDGGWCLAGPGRVGTVYPITMTLVQGGKDLNEITRTFGYSRDTISGEVTADGRLVLAGTLPERDFDYAEVVIGIVQFSAWDTSLDTAGAMIGGWTQDSTSYTGRRGTAHTVNELVTMTRVSQ